MMWRPLSDNFNYFVCYINLILDFTWINFNLFSGGTYSTRKQAVTSKKTIHPDYNDKTLKNDICILHFDEDLPLDKNHNMACLPNPSDQPAPGTECYIAGYGYTGEFRCYFIF